MMASTPGPPLAMVMDAAAYDHDILGDVDPEDLYAELRGCIDDIQHSLRRRGSRAGAGAMENFMTETLARMVYGSNLADGVGGDWDATLRFCEPVFRGESAAPLLPVSGDDLDDPSARVQHQSQVKVAPSRGQQQIIQHAQAAKFLLTELFLRGNALSEDLILTTHRILTYGIDSAQGTAAAEYGGVYRQCRAGPDHISLAVKAALAALEHDLAAARAAQALDPVALAARYCYVFLGIRPFLDANGRLARLVLNALLVRHAGLVVCVGVGALDRELYASIARATSRREADQCDCPSGIVNDDRLRPNHGGALASLTLQHARDTARQFAAAVAM